MGADQGHASGSGGVCGSNSGGQPTVRQRCVLGTALGGHAGMICRSATASTRVCTRASCAGRGLGVWERIFADLVRDKKNQYLMLDSTIVRAHQQAATGRKKGAAKTRLWGVSRGGLSTKISSAYR